MAKDPAQFFVNCYRQHGPVFRVRILNREYPVIAGAEAANFLGTQEGRESLRSKEFWQGLVDEYGATRTIPVRTVPRISNYATSCGVATHARQSSTGSTNW